VEGGMLWRNGCDGKVLRCGAGKDININATDTIQYLICAYCLCGILYDLLTMQLYLMCGHVLYGTPAFIQH
jgi:hypothetical protein